MRPIDASAVVLLMLLLPAAAATAAELEARTVAAYERHLADVERRFEQQVSGDVFMSELVSPRRKRLVDGEILAGPGGGDGIIDAPNGLIHHWRATVFIPGVTLGDVLAVAKEYSRYHLVYESVVGAGLLGREGDQYRVFLRLKRSAGVVTGVIDLWSTVEYRYPRRDHAVAVSKAACVRQVEDAGKPRERRLPPGVGSGYLWRADTFSKYFEADGGVFVELETIGLSRDYPPLLGWIIEPIARRLGRGSSEDSLAEFRRAVTTADRGKAATREELEVPRSWCGT